MFQIVGLLETFLDEPILKNTESSNTIIVPVKLNCQKLQHSKTDETELYSQRLYTVTT